MLIEVEHWSGAGNRFVIVDNRKKEINNQWNILVSYLCKRNNLPNAEGLLVLLEIDKNKSICIYDFYNPDGSTGVMCGNGARCAVRHAALTENLSSNQIELILNGCSYKSKLLDNNRVALEFPLYKELRFIDNWTYVDVGSHHVIIDARYLVESIDDFYQFDLIKFANENLNLYRNKIGINNINLNLAYFINDQSNIYLRTYENGVFHETQACGTGAISTAIAFWKKNIINNNIIQIIPISQRLLTVHLDIDQKKENILGMTLEGDAQQDAPSTLFDTTSMAYI
ncbi:unnamed protein product [Rotaria sordida]|uniref:diaminopimelate epimerase n=1 Tax=Rotaria sordida TaxID=392033 RepID=A0A813ZPI5_9BILA|nr:unnamed protein product [Rotaria sordida]CAF0921080.1 unnamed protein product [Rotaria sordida]CAF0940834.1 unnamed protein product [Rotaria sordida]CAF1172516.1 unnamed protein product [Rotaria sordida]CAF3690722.1 unnamed protein product [Rotaria sordida]